MLNLKQPNLEISKDLVATKFSEEFVYSNQEAMILTHAWNSNQNVLFFGKGGYGKSDFASFFGKILESEKLIKDNFTQVFGSGMSEDKLFGGFDMKKYKETGKMEYLLEESFANYEYVVFEELFDAPESVLLSLKDCLQRGYVMNGSQKFPVKTKMIVACTNKSIEDINTNDSNEALLQRFIFNHKVEWNVHKKENYNKMIFIRSKDKYDPLLSEKLCAFIEYYNTMNKNNHNISPRTAYKYYEVLLSNNKEISILSLLPYTREYYKEALANINVIIESHNQLQVLNEYRLKQKEITDASDKIPLEEIKALHDLFLNDSRLKNIHNNNTLKHNELNRAFNLLIEHAE